MFVTLIDTLRPGHELTYYPGETNFRMADLLVVTKTDSATPAGLAQVLENARKYRPGVPVTQSGMVITTDKLELSVLHISCFHTPPYCLG